MCGGLRDEERERYRGHDCTARDLRHSMDATSSSATAHLEAGGKQSVPLAEPTNDSRHAGKGRPGQPVLTAPLRERGQCIHGCASSEEGIERNRDLNASGCQKSRVPLSSLSLQRERVHIYLPVRAARTVQPPPLLFDAREARSVRRREHRPADPVRAEAVARLDLRRKPSWLRLRPAGAPEAAFGARPGSRPLQLRPSSISRWAALSTRSTTRGRPRA